MKKPILFVLMFFFGLTIYAQNQFVYGFEFAFSGSFFDKESAPYEDPAFVEGFEKTSRPAFELGVPVEYRMSGPLALTSGLFYTEKGGAYKTKNPNVDWVNQFSGEKEDDAYNYARYRLAYFEVPLMLNIDLFDLFNIDWNDQTIRLSGGVTAMANVASKFRYNQFVGGSEPEEKWESEKLDGAQPFMTSWITKLEYVGGDVLVLYANYSQNLSEVYDTGKSGFESYDVNMSTFSIGMGFLINKK